MASRTDEIRYVLLPGKLPRDHAHEKLHADAFRFWHGFWHEVLTANGSTEGLSVDDFLRQDVTALIVHQNEVIAYHGYTFFDLEHPATRLASYFRHFVPEYFEALSAEGYRHVMSLEYFSVHREWRSSRLGYSLGAVLLGLGMRFLVENPRIDAGVGMARTDVPVGRMCLDYGADVVVKDVEVHNTPCDLVAFVPERLHPAKLDAVKFQVERLWKNRLDARSLTPNEVEHAA